MIFGEILDDLNFELRINHLIIFDLFSSNEYLLCSSCSFYVSLSQTLSLTIYFKNPKSNIIFDHLFKKTLMAY